MKPAPFTYYDPRTVDEATDLVGRLDNARVLAGGQSLMPMMNFRFVMPDHLIDLNNVAGIDAIHVSDKHIAFGAMTRQRDIEFSSDIKAASPIILEALGHVGHRQTRNRGTIGGSLCHLDPSAELVNMALLHDAEMEAASKRGRRTMKASEFVAGYMTTSLAQDEILVGVSLNRWPKGHGYAFEEFARRHGDFAICAVGVLLTIASGKISKTAVTISGVGQTPSRAASVEALLAGQVPSKDLYRAAAAEAQKTEAISDAYVSAEYRKHLARIMTYRAVERAVERAGA